MNSQLEEMHRESYEKRYRASMSHLGTPPYRNLCVSTHRFSAIQKLPEPCPSGFLWRFNSVGPADYNSH
jgi:hypothetical protein